LEFVQLKSVVEKLPEGLETRIAEFGGNFSVGEGQLICVARAILKPSKILFVDEATANVDKRTDELIQTVLRTKFRDRTLITIAHRLNTIIDYDRIVVMSDGKVAEVGTPAELLAIPDGIFKSMAAESGIYRYEPR
jgi:ATP-binding cassette subfamily C (CFTR/MRP) protein 4